MGRERRLGGAIEYKLLDLHAFFYKQLLYKQGSTRQGNKLSNFSAGLKTAKQFEKCVNGPLGRSPTNFGKSYYLD